MDSGRGAPNDGRVNTKPKNPGYCPHLGAVLDGSEIRHDDQPTNWSPTLSSEDLLWNWKFLEEYLHLSRLELLDTTKIPYPECKLCVGTQLGARRLHLCLHCAACFCFGSNHLLSHFEARPDHFLAVDASNDHIYCRICSNYVFDQTLHEEMLKARHFAVTQYQQMTRPLDNRIDFEEWQPSEAELPALKAIPPLNTPLMGLRGLNNLGNTCFMNVILQSLVSNPMLANYFLADRHNRNFCPLTRDSKLCLGCEADLLIENMFNGDRLPFSPHRFLLTTWRSTDHLAGYEQQDAHDFYISTMNAIHTHIGESLIVEQEERIQQKIQKSQAQSASFMSNGTAMDIYETPIPVDIIKEAQTYTEDSFSDENCVCATHKSFAGFLRSDVHCLTCHNISTVKEAFLDIGLDLEHMSSDSQGPLTLCDGLSRFTQIETLDSFHCDACHTKATCTKQLSIEQLPLTLCFHLKRFKHTFTSTRKIDTYMEFPLDIDMTPYTFMSTSTQGAQTPPDFGEPEGLADWITLSRTADDLPEPNIPQNALVPILSNSSSAAQEKAIGASKRGQVPRADRSVYSLYAVVNHSGNMENGHYTCFVRHAETWYKCDDHCITKATKKEVLASRAYLLFYCRSVLEYQE